MPSSRSPPPSSSSDLLLYELVQSLLSLRDVDPPLSAGRAARMSSLGQITVFGGTGLGGLVFIEKALEKGYTVVAYARSPAKFSEGIKGNEKFRIVEGQLEDSSKIQEALTGSTIAVSYFGTPPFPKPPLPATRFYQTLLPLLSKPGVPNRLLATGGPSQVSPDDKPHTPTKLMVAFVKTCFPGLYTDFVSYGKLIQEQAPEGLEWTVVRVGFLNNKPLVKPEDGKGYTAGFIGDPGVGVKVSRAAVAEFMCDELVEKKWVGKLMRVSS